MRPLLSLMILIVLSSILWILYEQRGAGAMRIKYSGALEALTFWYAARAYPENDIPDRAHSAAFDLLKESRQKTRLNKFVSVAPWYTLGPHNQAGRTLAVALNPQNPNTVYAGSASGGLWRSYSAGRGESAWERVATGFPVLGVSTIAFAPNDSNTIYIGTGEVYNYEHTGPSQAFRSRRGTYGMGIVKTTDGGKTWAMSLDWSYNQQRGIWAVRVNPRNRNTVWAATTEGTYKSTDAGSTWTQVLDVIMAMDLVMNPVDTNIVFVSCGDFSSPGHGIYGTKDGGATWIQLTNGLPATFAGKAMLDIYEASPNVVFASIGNGFALRRDNASWLCRSVDDGDTWTIVTTQDYTQHQGWYSHDVGVNPEDSSEVYALGPALWKSTSGGRNLEIINRDGPFAGQVPPGLPEGGPTWLHGDNHAIAFHPTNRRIVYFANDGGVWRTTNGGKTFESCNGGYQTTQFYAGFASSQRDSNLAVGGLQDNVTSIFLGSNAWSRFHLLVAFGDGGWCAIDPRDDNLIYASNWFLEIYKSTDRGANWLSIAPPGGDRPTVFEAPFVLGVDNPNVLYAGRDIVYRSSTAGRDWIATNGGQPLDGNPVLAMAISYQNSDVVYAATIPLVDRVGVFRTSDGGQTWEDISGRLPNRFPMDITVDPQNDQNVYIAFSGFRSSHVFKSVDGGRNWQNIGKGLPDVPTSAVIVDPLYPDHIYVGNDITVYVSTDGGLSWQEFNEGLPEAMFTIDLSISSSNRKLRAVTHGNGVYERDLLGDAAVSVAETGVPTFAFSLEQSYPNPFNPETTIAYSLAQPDRVTLKIFNILGEEIRTLVANEFRNPGRYLASWDGRDDSGAAVASGIYVYRLQSGDFATSKRMVLMR